MSAPVDVKALEALTGGAQDMTGLAIITIEERDAVCAALRIAVAALRAAKVRVMRMADQEPIERALAAIEKEVTL